MSAVVIELFGVPRARAGGRRELCVEAATARQAVAELARCCPGLEGLLDGDRLAPQYLLSLDGERFIRDGDLDDPLPSGARLLLLSADAGG